jgi:hypothetical protein
MSLSAKGHKSQPSNIPTGTDIAAFVSKAISTVCGLTGPLLEDAATAATEDKKWTALSTELNEQFDRDQKSYAALGQFAVRLFKAQEMLLFESRCRRRGNCEICGG